LHSLDVTEFGRFLDGRTDHFWTEPIKPGNGSRISQSVDRRPPDDVTDPRSIHAIQLSYWQKFNEC